ncbi:AmmeMemoRadiSam system protein B [Rhizobium sp. SL86]|uniref:AmmeMemoRadiSam system protein B n=1 Tax=Rhizobium sp. SL86 TaxID=2995148 RepID=UPI002276181C|nr:AmmeMemoRadiSam system protein B [Rhizobium sp. SL86]MCY1669019.1 AmmeMemoRadiSam system protein B [Rhizobium sp. SL86]
MDQLLAPVYDRALLSGAIAAEKPSFPVPTGVTGITVPHHLLSADLIARGFWAASEKSYKRVIVLAPDHFRLVKGRFATGYTSFKTVFGTLDADHAAVEKLLEEKSLFETASFDAEHGLLAEMPFIRHFFPEAKVVPVLASIFTTPEDWKAAADLLRRTIDEDTLVVQSTDYSHYLPLSEAVQRDQETIAAITARDPAAVVAMLQPAHMDSKAAQFIQMRLQEDVFAAAPTILANRNSAEYGGSQDNTTSYVVTVYHRQPDAFSAARYPDHSVTYFGGDTLVGRFFLPSLTDEAVVSRLADAVRTKTAGGEIIVNLEGVLSAEVVTNPPPGAHLMHTDVAAPLFRVMNITAAGLANNHAGDFGSEGLEGTVAALETIGVKPLRAGQVSDFGTFRLMPLTLPTTIPGGKKRVEEAIAAACRADAAPPFIVMAHWGAEYTSRTGPEEFSAAEALAACGVSAIIGAHSHLASDRIDLISGHTQSVFSLGNFLFDQNGTRSSSALLELRSFQQGTIVTRLVPLPNLFDLANALHRDRN